MGEHLLELSRRTWISPDGTLLELDFEAKSISWDLQWQLGLRVSAAAIEKWPLVKGWHCLLVETQHASASDYTWALLPPSALHAHFAFQEMLSS